MMTRQEIFNTVRDHLLKQGEGALWQSVKYSCAYRGMNGTKCAAGALIKDEFYDPNLEGKIATHQDVRYALIKSGVNMENMRTVDLVDGLQSIHDSSHNVPKTDWPRQLHALALQFGLEP